MEAEIFHKLMLRFSDFVAETMGLHFPASRLPELQRSAAAMAEELGLADAAACMQRLMSAPLTPAQLETLAGNLTVGETYFFREPRSLEILTDHILPQLLRARKLDERPLRIWSAACCTGEEPYSIAIALRRMLPAWDNLTLLATDINPRFLRKALAGVFSQWSFRAAPPWLKERYFRAAPDGRFEILPEIRRMVRFVPLNLVDDVYPSPVNNTHAMDVIVCRNVLMYFTALQAQKVIAKLYRAQAEGGWLIVSPSELPQVASSPYVPVNIDGAIVFRKESGKTRQVAKVPWQAAIPPLAMDRPVEKPATENPVLVGQGLSVGRALPAVVSDGGQCPPYVESLSPGGSPAELGPLARALANQGQLHEAIDCCDRWIAADKLNPASHYLRAVILQERGAIDEAGQSLRKALYLDPRLVLAHFALGNIARDRGHFPEARKHLENALELSAAFRPDEVLPESEGVTAGRFAGIIRALIEAEAGT